MKAGGLSIRQFHDMKDTVDTATIQPTGLTGYADL